RAGFRLTRPPRRDTIPPGRTGRAPVPVSTGDRVRDVDLKGAGAAPRPGPGPITSGHLPGKASGGNRARGTPSPSPKNGFPMDRLFLLAALSGAHLAALADAGAPPEAVERATLHVGQERGDLRGNDNRVIQGAIDHLANLGGGTVRVGPGRYA